MDKRGFSLGLISKYRIEIYGISILLIMFFHFSQNHVDHYRASGATGIMFITVLFFRRFFGSIGVEIFSFMSGLSMYYAFSSNNDIGRFYTRRYRRILIPYFYVGIIFWVVKDILLLSLGPARLLADFTFVTFFTEGVRTIWFILFLLLSYLLVPLVYKAVNGKDGEIRIPAAIVIITAVLLFPVLIEKALPDIFANIEVLIARLPLFILGLLAGKQVKAQKKLPYPALAGLAVIALIAKHYEQTRTVGSIGSRYIAAVFGVFLLVAITIILALIDKAMYIRRILSFFGTYSLELYLLHVTMRNLSMTIGLQEYRTSRYAVIVGASMLLSPFLNWLTKLTGRGINSILCRKSSA